MKGSLKICRPRGIFFTKKMLRLTFIAELSNSFFFLLALTKKLFFSTCSTRSEDSFWFSIVDIRVEVNFAPCVALLHAPSCDVHLQDQKIVVTFTSKAIVKSMFFLSVLTLVC